jgi:hypothetical protein
MRTPLLFDLTSSIAFESGAVPSALIPTFWEKLIRKDPTRKKIERKVVFMDFYFFTLILYLLEEY